MPDRRRARWGAAIALATALALPAAGLARLSNGQARAAATKDAVALLDRAALPSGAVPLGAEPAGDHGLFAHPAELGPPQSVDRHEWWRTAGGLGSVSAYILGHPPAGTSDVATSELGGPGIPPNETVSFSLPPRRGYSTSRSLSYELVELDAGGTGIRVDAEIAWLRQRSAREVVPAGVRAITVTSAGAGPTNAQEVTVTARSTVRRIIRAFDALPIIQPGIFACPALPGDAPTVTLDFLSAAGGRILARASGLDLGYTGGPCNAIAFTIGGHRQTPLLAADFYRSLQRWITIRLR